MSSSEAEYHAIAMGVTKLLLLKVLLKDVEIQVKEPMKLYYDNKDAVIVDNNLVFHDWTKHVEIDCTSSRKRLIPGSNISLCEIYDPIDRHVHQMVIHCWIWENADKLNMFDMYTDFRGNVKMWVKCIDIAHT